MASITLINHLCSTTDNPVFYRVFDENTRRKQLKQAISLNDGISQLSGHRHKAVRARGDPKGQITYDEYPARFSNSDTFHTAVRWIPARASKIQERATATQAFCKVHPQKTCVAVARSCIFDAHARIHRTAV